MLYHRDCGGTLSIDISKMISWKAPGVSIQPDGLKVGVTEINSISELDPDKANFVCEKCKAENLPLAELENFADVECPVCSDKTPIGELMQAKNGLCLCPNCLKIAKGEKTTKKERILKVLRYFNLEGSGITFKPFSSTIVKRIIF